MYGIIYKITNLVNGKIYIGQTTQSLRQRWKGHVNDKRMITYDALKKYGKENFKIEIVRKCESEKELDYYEMMFILFVKNLHMFGCYNADRGGQHGFRGQHHSKKSKKLLAQAHNGKKASEETRLKMSLSKLGNKIRLGHKHSEKSKRKIGKSRKLAWKKVS